MVMMKMMLRCLLLVVLVPSLMGYPVYGTKRYGRTNSRRVASWNPYQQMIRTQRYPMNYYELYPYTQTYPDDYYYSRDAYPVYYPARTSKYEVYQAVLPYYYQDRNPYYYPDEEDLLQDAEREEREESQPIGQEMLYENDSEENLDDVNAAFLQNLIMTQMYKDAIDEQPTYGRWEDSPRPSSRQEDEDVRELKQLAKLKPRQPTDDIHWLQSRMKSPKRSSPPTATTTTSTTSRPDGQKEEVRPEERKRAPSVYDTIKHMLEMEKSLETYDAGEPKPGMRKRIVANEESLTQQLSLLKKGQ